MRSRRVLRRSGSTPSALRASMPSPSSASWTQTRGFLPLPAAAEGAEADDDEEEVEGSHAITAAPPARVKEARGAARRAAPRMRVAHTIARAEEEEAGGRAREAAH
jgi:hypothetical protein